MGGPGLKCNLNGNRNAKLQHWPFGALGSLYEVVQNSADRGFSRTTAPGRLGKIAPLCKQKPRRVEGGTEMSAGWSRV